METYEIEKNIGELKLEKLKLILNEEKPDVSFLNQKLIALTKDLRTALKEKDKEREVQHQDQLSKKVEAINLLTSAVNSLTFESMEKGFNYNVNEVWKMFYSLIHKQNKFNFGNSSGEGFVEVKRNLKTKIVLIKYDFYCHDRKKLKFTFLFTDNLQEVLRSIVVSEAENSSYQSNFGHGLTTPIPYNPTQVLGDILWRFLCVVLDGLEKKEYYQ